jgi:hypothetical protein
LSSQQIRHLLNLLESIEWKGNKDGREEAADTAHTIEDAETYVRQHYPVTKMYDALKRAEPGFRAGDAARPDTLRRDILRRSGAVSYDVDSVINQLQLGRNSMMSGSAQMSNSIGNSWHVHENPTLGIAVIYYQSRGMGPDSLLLAAKDKSKLDQMQQVFQDADILPNYANIQKEKLAAAQKLMQAKGIQIGTKLKDGSQIISIGRTGILKLTRPDGTTYQTRAGRIRKQDIAT